MGWFHLVFFCIVIPWAAWRSRRHLAEGHNPSRRRHFVAVLVQLLIFLGLSLWVARLEGLPVLAATAIEWPAAAGAALLLALGLLLMAPRWRRSVELRERNVHLFMPRDGTERALWVGISFAAAASEEVTYRGVMFLLLAGLTGSAWVGALVAAAVFGFSHVVQGWKSAGIVTGVALALHGLVAVSGSLYLAIAIHFLYDLIAGLAYGRLGHELGYPIEGIT
jgi:membrane protease YdiL (CAAX protease family)